MTDVLIRLQVVSANSGRPLAGCPVRLWSCAGGSCQDRRTGPVEERTSGGDGWAEFRDLTPAGFCHLHFEISGQAGRLALPENGCVPAYAPGVLPRTDLAAAFGAGEPPLIASVTGDARRGLVATRTLEVGR